jgi:hypothetical protein
MFPRRFTQERNDMKVLVDQLVAKRSLDSYKQRYDGSYERVPWDRRIYMRRDELDRVVLACAGGYPFSGWKWEADPYHYLPADTVATVEEWELAYRIRLSLRDEQ